MGIRSCVLSPLSPSALTSTLSLRLGLGVHGRHQLQGQTRRSGVVGRCRVAGTTFGRHSPVDAFQSPGTRPGRLGQACRERSESKDRTPDRGPVQG